MYDKIPATLFRTKRGLCPSCGAPLPLGEDASNIVCGFCGGKAVLQRRLRRAEPEVEGAPLRQFDSHDHAGWERTDELRETFAKRATCPGCGQGIEAPEHGERFACQACGTECHLERRLVPPERHPLRGVPRPRHPDERYSYDLQEDEDAQTEHLVWRLSREEDLDRAMSLAAYLEQWRLINETTSRLMPALLERMHRAASSGHRPLVFEMGSAVDKCLCSEGEKLRDTIEALEEWVVRVPAERQLLSSLGLGPAMGLKLLLDSSMLAYRAGDLSQSVAALFGINWMLQRNYPQHPIISQILMHRMFYLSGPPLAFCVMFMHGQVSDVAFRYDPQVTLSFLDDAVAERPCLVPSLDHERAFWCGHAASEADWESRFAFVQDLRTEEARLAAWKWYLGPPEGATPEFYERYVALLWPMLAHESAAWRDMAERRLEWMVRRLTPTPDVFFRLIAEHGESLPGHVRQAMLSQHPKCGLKHENLPYWQPEKKTEEHSEVVEARRLYREGLDLHLAQQSDDRAAWKAYWDARGGRTRDLPPIFDGLSDGPAPPKRGRDKARYPRPWEDGGPAGSGDGSGSGAGEDGRPAPGDETAPPEHTAHDQEAEQDDAEEPVRLSAEELAALERSGEDPEQPGGAGVGFIPSDGSVTIWEYVASLPEDQRGAYDEILRQMEPYRAQMEAAIALQRRAIGPGRTPPPDAAASPEARGGSSPGDDTIPLAPETPDPPPAEPPGPYEGDEWVQEGQDRPWKKSKGGLFRRFFGGSSGR